MADNVAIQPAGPTASGVTILSDEVVDLILGTGQVQWIKVMDGQLDSTTKLRVYANGEVEATSSGVLPFAIANDGPENRITGQAYPLSLTPEGRLRVSSSTPDIDQVWQHIYDNPWSMDAAQWGIPLGVNYV